ncbi:MAG: extracellular solute-binding protein [Chloroflexi bacterium]|nr:extracellular solute-binding protein [Chloroflexota bacterium]
MHASRRAATLALAATAVVSSGAIAQSPDLGPATGEVSVLMIGWSDQDGIDASTGKPTVGIGHLETLFEAKHPDIDLKIINIPWGSGSTGYGPKTESMVQANEACIYDMPASFDYAKRGLLQDLDVLIAQDASFEDIWEGNFLENSKGWTPENANATIFLPGYSGVRVTHWDAQLFEDWGVEPLSANPTVEEITEKAAAMTGINPVTGEQNYGYWYQGQYLSWQFQSLAHALGANWGTVNEDGTWTITWDTPEYLAAVHKLLELAQYAPEGALAADAMPQGFLTDQNVVAIIPEGEPGYFIQELINGTDEQRARFRTSYNLRGPDGLGGLSTPGMYTMAASCPNKLAAWEVLKFLTSDPDVQRYYFAEGGNLPTIIGGAELMPELAVLPDAEIIATEPAFEEPRYPWAASTPRWALQTALQAALAGTMTPEDALKQAQAETDAWLANPQ